MIKKIRFIAFWTLATKNEILKFVFVFYLNLLVLISVNISLNYLNIICVIQKSPQKNKMILNTFALLTQNKLLLKLLSKIIIINWNLALDYVLFYFFPIN
jgi:hypothetical protein